jgi:hypothetical protein
VNSCLLPPGRLSKNLSSSNDGVEETTRVASSAAGGRAAFLVDDRQNLFIYSDARRRLRDEA